MDIHTYFSELGKRSASRLTPDQRKQRAINAARKRWGNSKLDANGKQGINSGANGKHIKYGQSGSPLCIHGYDPVYYSVCCKK